MANAVPVKVSADSPVIGDILELIRRNFAYMDTRIDPPSSMHRLSRETIQDQCRSGEVWTLGFPPWACVFLKKHADSLYIGKLTVDQEMRGRGAARHLLALAEERAKAQGLPALELHTRIELVENHRIFAQLGFVKTGDGTHEGFDRPTYIVMRKTI